MLCSTPRAGEQLLGMISTSLVKADIASEDFYVVKHGVIDSLMLRNVAGVSNAQPVAPVV